MLAVVGGIGCWLWDDYWSNREAIYRHPIPRGSTTSDADEEDDWTVAPGPLLRLWPAVAPLSETEERQDVPVLEVFAPARELRNGAAIIVMPGGAYHGYTRHEAAPVAQWWAQRGVAAFVLRFRLAPRHRHPAQLLDAQRAVRYVRATAAQWKIDRDRIGVIGFSAGGHLASLVSTIWAPGNPAAADEVERFSSRPDVQILLYPVISMERNMSRWTSTALMGDDPPVAMIEELSTHKRVTAATPPAFIAHAVNDSNALVANSDLYASALNEAGVAHLYLRLETGRHGLGLGGGWTQPCLAWLRQRGFLAHPASGATTRSAP